MITKKLRLFLQGMCTSNASSNLISQLEIDQVPTVRTVLGGIHCIPDNRSKYMYMKPGRRVLNFSRFQASRSAIFFKNMLSNERHLQM